MTDRDNRILVGQVAQPSGPAGGVLPPLLKRFPCSYLFLPGPAGSVSSLPGDKLELKVLLLKRFPCPWSCDRYDIHVHCLELRAHTKGTSLLLLAVDVLRPYMTLFKYDSSISVNFQ